MANQHLLLDGEESERLLFRKVREDDFDSWLPFHEEPESMRYFVGDPGKPEEACRNWLNKTFHRYENGLGGLNALISKETGELIGMCGLLIQTVDGIQELEIGYSMLPAQWGKGYASEAAIRCREYAVANKLSDSIISIIHIENIGSRKVAQKNGMTLDKKTDFKGIPVDIYRYTLDK